MVNTGKPSRGCYMCRARRIKCDEGKPSCMRCQKSKRICPGYRDAFELKLRDESKSTKKKLNRRASQDQSALNSIIHKEDAFHNISPTFSSSSSSFSRSSHSRQTSTSSISSQTSNESQASVVSFHRHHSFIAGHMTTPLAQQASCYFLANFVLVPEMGTMRGYLDFVIPLLKQRAPPQCLVLAFSAVTLAALGTRPNSKALLPTADLWYLKALKEINCALQDPKNASSDSTLASVMLMASFEQLTPSRMKVRGWSSHIDGAVAVMKSRTSEQWQTSVGKELFIAVRAHMTLHCIANSKPVNDSVDWMSVTADDPVVESFATANLKMAQLRADNDITTMMKARTAENIEKVLILLRRAEALDEQYLDWIKALPSAWQINTVAWIEGEVPDLTNSVVHPGRVDAYGELWMAYKYNIVRGCRLLIWTTILRCVAWLGHQGDYRLTPEYTTASRICRQLIEDITASVPYFFGWNRGKDPAMADRSNFACGINDPTSVKPLVGIFAMWPIFVAASSDFATPSQRIFLRGRLKTIAEIMGINQALIMLQVQLVHPSLYIARERMSLQPTTCQSNDTKVTIVSGVPSATIFTQSPPLPVTVAPVAPVAPIAPAAPPGSTWITSPSSDQMWHSSPESSTSTSNWIPRTFVEPLYLQDAGMPRMSGVPDLPFSHQSPPNFNKNYNSYQHAGFGTVSSV